MVMSDLFPNLPIALHKVGSNYYEDFYFFWTRCEEKKPFLYQGGR
jgi:hypothetical protein